MFSNTSNRRSVKVTHSGSRLHTDIRHPEDATHKQMSVWCQLCTKNAYTHTNTHIYTHTHTHNANSGASKARVLNDLRITSISETQGALETTGCVPANPIPLSPPSAYGTLARPHKTSSPDRERERESENLSVFPCCHSTAVVQ